MEIENVLMSSNATTRSKRDLGQPSEPVRNARRRYTTAFTTNTNLSIDLSLQHITMSTNNSRRSARQSTFPQINSASTSAVKARHLSHLHSQLAQLSANLADLENLMRMTAVQAEYMRGLGGYCGSL